MESIYLVRHCKATGQEPEASLTEQGRAASLRLVDFFKDKNIDVIYSSPFKRAIESIEPFAKATGHEVIIDPRLRERVLSSLDLEDWMGKLEATYEDLELKFEGGESSHEAMRRGIECIEEVFERPGKSSIIVSHGALMSLIIKHYQKEFGFNEWKQMTNPDVYHLKTNIREVIIDHMIIDLEG
jgi:2,3-bisphosphoglycerate-dependent phosphoglycerate mutase